MSREQNKDGQDPLFEPVRPKVRIISIHGSGKERSTKIENVAERLLEKPGIIHLFTDKPDRVFDVKLLGDYIQDTMGPNFTVIQEGDIWKYLAEKNPGKHTEILEKLADTKVWATRKSGIGFHDYPLSKEEKMKLEEEATFGNHQTSYRDFAIEQTVKEGLSPSRVNRNHYYEGLGLLSTIRHFVPNELVVPGNDRRDSILVVTGRGIGDKWGDFGRSVHMRGGYVTGNTALVSTTGLVDAPGEPLEVQELWERHGYGILPVPQDPEKAEFFHQVYNQKGLNGQIIEDTINEVYRDQMLGYEDPRLNEAIKGMSLSWTIYTLGESDASTCSSTDLTIGKPDLTKFCRLHDAHWQEELMATQVNKEGKPEFCDYHTKLFATLNNVKG